MGGEWVEPWEWSTGDLITAERLNRINANLKWLKQKLEEAPPGAAVNYWNLLAQDDVIRPAGLADFYNAYNVLVLTSTNPSPGIVLRDSAGTDRAALVTYQEWETALAALNTHRVWVTNYVAGGPYTYWEKLGDNPGSISIGDWTTGHRFGIIPSTGVFEGVSPTIRPEEDNTGTLGDPTHRWAAIYAGSTYFGDLNLVGRGKNGGDWTIREGPDGLYARNNRTGKLYRFRLEEVKPEHI